MSEKFNPKELEFDVSETCEAIEMCVECCIAEMKRSKYGVALANNPPRYADFWGGKKSYWHDKAEFRKYLGDDVDPVLHGPYQALNVAIPMIAAQNSDPTRQHFTREEGKLLVIGHVFHDAHEGKTGDLSYPEKTRQTYEDELKINMEVVQEILLLDDCDPFLAKYRGVVGDLEGWSFAGRAFSAGEWCGYMMTGLRAWSLRHHLPLNNMQKQAMERMGREVTLGIVNKVAECAEEFTFCANLIRENEVALEEMAR